MILHNSFLYLQFDPASGSRSRTALYSLNCQRTSDAQSVRVPFSTFDLDCSLANRWPSPPRWRSSRPGATQGHAWIEPPSPHTSPSRGGIRIDTTLKIISRQRIRRHAGAEKKRAIVAGGEVGRLASRVQPPIPRRVHTTTTTSRASWASVGRPIASICCTHLPQSGMNSTWSSSR